MSVSTYAGYELVEQREEFEYRYINQSFAGIYTVLKRRSVMTMTWEATLTDELPDVAGSVDQGYPGAQNPGGLGSDWRLYSVEYSKALSVPMSKVVRETWMKTGAWETVD